MPPNAERPEFGPTERIPAERDLAEHLGISRMTLRKALQILIDRGMLERRGNRGTFVTAPALSGHSIRWRARASPKWLNRPGLAQEARLIYGVWMAASVGAFYFANTTFIIVVVQLLFGLVANAVWPIYYAVASDSAQPSVTSTANGIITTAMFIGGGIAPILMGTLISMGGGWTSLHGYTVCFFVMAGCALGGAFLQLFSHRPQVLVAQTGL